MVYNYQKLCAAIFELDLDELQSDHAKHLAHLVKVYRDAYINAPLGIVGVGLNTHAENALIEYQTKKKES
jgi:hypothetical protein